MKILIVEDDFISRKILQKILLPLAECDIAVDGLEAIQAFEYARQEGKPYDLICLDIMMPKIDGFNALRKIREAETKDGNGSGKHQATKVIITTAIDDQKTVEESYKSFSVSAYIVKPITRQALLEEMRKIKLIESF